MATFLSKLFKPKWQNKHLPTRVAAIEELDANTEENQNILYDIAKNDEKINARSAAIKKLSQSTQLIELHTQAESDTKTVIEQRLYELANAQSLTIYDLIPDNKLLTEMIIKSDQPDAFILGLGHIEEPASLLAIAQSSKTSKIRQAAAELLESEEQLQALAQTAKSKDKSVYQIAKNKLTKLKDFHKSKQESQDKIESLLGALEEHARTDNLKLYEAKLTSLLQRWTPLQNEADEAQEQRFDTAYTTCKQRLDAIVKEQEEAEEQERLVLAGGNEQDATLMTLQDTLDKFRSQSASFQELSALDAIIKTQETRWLEATRHQKVDKTKNKHYQVLMSTLRQYFNSLKSLSEFSDKIANTIKSIESSKQDPKQLNESMQQLGKTIKRVDWPTGYALPEQLEKAQSALGKSADIKEKLAQSAKDAHASIQTLISKLDQALDDKQIKKSQRIHKEIQSLLSQLDARQGEKIHNQLTLRINQLNDLRDWQGFASTPRQLELCETMERLVDQHIEPQDKANRIKAMQKEWKALGGASDKAIWDRFKAAADKAYEPCKVFFDEQNRLKDANLERRKVLIQQLKDFVDGNDWDNPDWKLAEQINRKARSDWKEAFPIDFKANKPLQNEFNQLLEKLDDQLKKEKEKNKALKAEIADKAKALIEEDNLETAINNAKALQQEWKQIGITDHRQDRKLWQAFRKSCDQIFARRDQDRVAKKEESAAAIQAFEAFCQEIETYAEAAAEKSLETLNSALADFRKQFKQHASLPRGKQESLFNRFEANIAKLKSAISKHENQAYLDQLASMRDKANICRELYSNPEADANALDEQFNALSLPSAIENKFKSLWISVKAGSVASESVITDDEAKNLCIRCEIAAGIDSPESDKELRMQLQVSRLSEGMSSGSEHQSREEQLKAQLIEWYLKVGMSSKMQDELEVRIGQAINSLFA